jgi:hypothetical protein
MSTEELAPSSARVDLYWMRLGAGDNTHCVRGNGRIFEWVIARFRHREPLDLYHSALEVRTGDGQFVIEMAPVWGTDARPRRRGRGPVGLRWLGHSQIFRRSPMKTPTTGTATPRPASPDCGSSAPPGH